MRLRDLDAHFLKWGEGPVSVRVLRDGADPEHYTDADIEERVENRAHHTEVDTLAEADGVRFLCPKCVDGNGHSVICWFVGKVPDDAGPKPGRWNPSGTSLDDLTFVGPGAVSVLLLSGCQWHGFVTNGSAA